MIKLPLRPFLCICLMLLAACKDITHVQTGYVADRDECRGTAESNVGVYSQQDAYPLSDKDRSGALLQLFCECMKTKDWKVAGCPKPPAAVAAAPSTAPTVVVVQSPTSQPAILPQSTYTPAPAQAAKKKPKVCTPPSICPAPSTTMTGNPQTPAQSNQQLQELILRQ